MVKDEIVKGKSGEVSLFEVAKWNEIDFRVWEAERLMGKKALFDSNIVQFSLYNAQHWLNS